jgi:N-acetylglutamate synthase-like GNAT family acetyltransferase
MSKLTIQFYPSSRLSQKLEIDIQKLIEQTQDAPIPETPNNSLIFIPTLENKVIGYASVTIQQKSAHISSIFIQANQQGQLFGFRLVLDILDKLSKTGCQKISLHCSEKLLGFFQSLGFIATRELIQPEKNKREKYFELENPCPAFFLETLKHTLRTNAISLEILKSSHKLFGLSYDKQHYQYTNKSQFLAFHRNMLSQAQKQIWIISDNITTPLLNDEIVRDSLLRLAKRNAKAEIRILLEDDKKGAGHYNPTIELAQKLTSFIEIRTIQKGAKKPNEMITTVDFNAGIFRKDLNNYTGFAHYNNHLIAQRLRDKFEHHWQFAKPSMQLRRLSI